MRSTAPELQLQRHDEPVHSADEDVAAVPTVALGATGAVPHASASSRVRAKYAVAVRRRQQLARQRRDASVLPPTEIRLDEARKTKKEPKTTQATPADALTPASEILQRWDGVVLGVNEETFRARLLDERTGRPRLEADVYVEDVSEHDRSLLRPGAVFYWHIGYRDPHGDRERFSRIRFQRLPPRTEADVARADRRARERRELLGYA